MPMNAVFPILVGATMLLLVCLVAARAICSCERDHALARVRLRNERVMATLDMEECGYDARAPAALPEDAPWLPEPNR